MVTTVEEMTLNDEGTNLNIIAKYSLFLKAFPPEADADPTWCVLNPDDQDGRRSFIHSS
jgi:hypothetical protein